MSFLKDDGQLWPELPKHDEACEFCGAGVDEDCGPECPTQAVDPLAAIGIPKDVTP